MGSGETSIERVDGADHRQLLRIQALASRCWSWSSRWHPGELTWFWWEGGGPGSDSRVATWRSADTTIAWARHEVGGHLDLQIDPERLDVLDDVLEWFAGSLDDATVVVCEAETVLVAALTSRGWAVAPDGPSFAHLRLDLEDLPEAPVLPHGVSLRTVAQGPDVERRASLHRRAFGALGPDASPSTGTYRRLREDPLYRGELDWMAVLGGSAAVAFCLSWLDEQSSVAVLEPVGTDPEHRRRGLGRAVVVASLQSAARLGARHARVCARVDGSGDEAAVRTYESLGFRRYARNVRLVRTGASPDGGTDR